MHPLRPWPWIALAAALCLSVPRARADLITPDSIPNPPSAVGSANGTYIYSNNNLVKAQYTGLGLNFGGTTAITNLNGVNVWAPTEALAQPASRISGGPPMNFPVGQINYAGSWAGGSFVLPGTLTPTTATSLTVEIIGRQVGVNVFYANNSGVGIPAIIQSAVGPHGGQLYTLSGPGITSFSVFAPIIDPPPGAMAVNPAWGVAEVSFTPTHAPEPASLVLAGLGALSLTISSGWRRVRGARWRLTSRVVSC